MGGGFRSRLDRLRGLLDLNATRQGEEGFEASDHLDDGPRITADTDPLLSRPAVHLSRIRKSFGKIAVIKDFTLTVPSGQKLAIIGPSGSGKTTLLRLIMTLERPDSGTIEIDGELLGHRRVEDRLVADSRSHIRQVRGKVGMVFQQFNLFPHMTALQNVIEAPMRNLGLKRRVAEEEGLALLALVGLNDKAHSHPRELSGGQQQRVAIARALALHPKIMMFDEVTSALDPELIGDVLDVMRTLAHQEQMTMLIVTHEMYFARDVSDRVIFMDEGQIVEDTDPTTIFSKPKSERTKAFLRAIIER